jgi:RimJ/RimL family protein N-acetyltransferase
VLLDHNLHPDAASRYAGRVPEGSHTLLGPEYALLRDEFAQARGSLAARSGPVNRVLVSFGGADAANFTGLALEALVLSGMTFGAVDVVIGVRHEFRDEIESACARHGFRCHVQTDRMAALMAAADLAIGAGGITTWERCCLGVPALAIPVAANQQDQIHQAALQGLVCAPADQPSTGSALAVHVRAVVNNPLLREMLTRNGMRAVDGRGVERVVRVMDRESVHVREATMDDAEALFRWRNDETVRMASRDSRPISWPSHETWLGTVLADDTCALLVGERHDQPVGVVRFDVHESCAQVSIYRVTGSGQPGLGSSLLLASEQWLATRHPEVTSIVAEVLADNERSHRLFRSAGYALRSARYQKRLRIS